MLLLSFALTTRLTRLTSTLTGAAAFAAALALAWAYRAALFGSRVAQAEAILPLLPWWVLVSLGSYALVSVGYGLIALEDCDAAAAELSRELVGVKRAVRAAGFDVSG